MSHAAVVAVVTKTLIGIIGTLVRMQFSARVSLLTVAQASKFFAVECSRVNANVSETAVIVGASTSHEIGAGRRIVWSYNTSLCDIEMVTG